MQKEYPFVDSLETLQAEIDRVKRAQQRYAQYTQEQVDRIFLAAATAANKARVPLAKAAVAEKAIPRCNLCFITGEQMQAQLAAFLQIMGETAPNSIGGQIPGDDFYCILK